MVLDEEDGQAEVLARLADERGQLVRFLRVHAGGRLVEQEQLRLRGERAGDLEAALLAVGQGSRHFVLEFCEADDLEQLERAGALGALLLRVQTERGGEDVGRAADVHRGEHVFKDRHGLEQADVLERAGDAALGDGVGRADDMLVVAVGVFARVELFHLAARIAFDDGLAVEFDLAVRRLIDAGDAVEGRGLARAVRADERDDLVLVDVHGEVVHGDDAAELHRDVFYMKDVLFHVICPPFAACAGAGRSARGRP